MSDPTKPEGWMAEKPSNTRRYHYVRNTLALCRGYGFYFGELTPDDGKSPRGREDCAACFKKLRGER